MAPDLPAGDPLSAADIIALFQTLQPDPDWSFAGCTSRDTCRLTHGYHRYPAKFIPQLVYRLLDEYAAGLKDPVINDLFMGSGTTIACAVERGYRATGTDVNEVACLITQAKATPIEPARIESRLAWLHSRLRDLDRGYANNGLPRRIPENERLSYWFPEPQITELGQILAALLEIEDQAEQTFFLCGFSHILKNCSWWSMGSTKPTRDRLKEPRRPWITYQVHLRKMADRNRVFWNTVPARVREQIDRYVDVRCQDARRQPFPDESVDLQITSPPYVTSYEYADLHQLTALWLDFTDDLRAFRTKFIGTGRPDNHRPLRYESELVADMVEAMAQADGKLRPGIERFFSDMNECFAETFRILKPGGRICYVIGNTTLKRVPILNAQAFVELMQNAGFRLERVIEREIPLKTLPQIRNPVTGRFARTTSLRRRQAYPTEYIIVARKPA